MLNKFRRLLGSKEGGRPQSCGTLDLCRLSSFFIRDGFGPNDLLGKFGQTTGVFETVVGETGISTDFSKEVVFGLTVACKVKCTWESVQVHDEVDHLVM